MSNNYYAGNVIYNNQHKELGEYVESIFAELIAGKGAVRETLKRHLAEA